MMEWISDLPNDLECTDDSDGERSVHWDDDDDNNNNTSIDSYESINGDSNRILVKKLLQRNKPDWDQVQQILESNPILIQRPIDSYGYVLHHACWGQAPYDLVKYILTVYPKAIQIQAFRCRYIGWYLSNPLNIACSNNQSSLSVIQLLIDTHPQAIQEPDEEGDYPLHTAIRNNQTLSVIQLLTTKYPKAVQEYNIRGFYPLHLACFHNHPVDVIQLLIDVYPEAIYIKDRFGASPFHYACLNHESESKSVVKYFLNLYPDLIQDQTTSGSYPLRLTCSKIFGNDTSQNEPVQQYILQRYPDAQHQKDHTGWSPSQLFAERRQTIYTYLMNKYSANG